MYYSIPVDSIILDCQGGLPSQHRIVHFQLKLNNFKKLANVSLGLLLLCPILVSSFAGALPRSLMRKLLAAISD